MNLNLVKINVIVLLLIIETHGGVIEGVYGRIKNTTAGLKQDVKNVWSYSKGLVGLDNTVEGEQKEEERGLIGGMVHSAQEKMHSLHEQLWVVDEIPNDSGLLWNMYCRLKQRLEKAKNFILGNGDKPAEANTQPPNPEALVIKDTMDKLFNADGTRKVDGDAFNEAVENLRKKLNEMRKSSESNIPVHHGEGLLDIRTSGAADVQKNFQNNAADTAAVGNEIYDKVYDNVNTANDGINKNINNGMNSVRNGYENVKDGVIGLNDIASDVAATERYGFVITQNKQPKS